MINRGHQNASLCSMTFPMPMSSLWLFIVYQGKTIISKRHFNEEKQINMPMTSLLQCMHNRRSHFVCFMAKSIMDAFSMQNRN